MSVLSKDKVREIFMAHGFTIKEGQDDLKEYVYAAAQALVEAAVAEERAKWPEPVECGCYAGECESKPAATCRMTTEIRQNTAPPAAPVVPEGWRNAAEKGLLALNQAVNLNQLGWQEAELVRQGRAELSAMLAAPAPRQDNGGAA